MVAFMGLSLDYAPPSLSRPPSRVFERRLGAVRTVALLVLRAATRQTAGEPAPVFSVASLVGDASRLGHTFKFAG